MHPVIKLLGSNFHGFQKEIVGGGPLVFENLRWLLTWPRKLKKYVKNLDRMMETLLFKQSAHFEQCMSE